MRRERQSKRTASPFRFCMLFEGWCYEYLIRISRAMALIRRFKQMTGMTPNRYRKLSG